MHKMNSELKASRPATNNRARLIKMQVKLPSFVLELESEPVEIEDLPNKYEGDGSKEDPIILEY